MIKAKKRTYEKDKQHILSTRISLIDLKELINISTDLGKGKSDLLREALAMYVKAHHKEKNDLVRFWNKDESKAI